MNIVILTLEGIVEDEILNELNLIFTYIFTFEMIIKFLALGITGTTPYLYFKYFFN